MPATIATTSIGVLVNGEHTLADVNDLFDILDEEKDFGSRLKLAIVQRFNEICAEHVEMFNQGVGLRPDLVMTYIHQMQLCAQLLQNLYPQYLQAIRQAQEQAAENA